MNTFKSLSLFCMLGAAILVLAVAEPVSAQHSTTGPTPPPGIDRGICPPTRAQTTIPGVPVYLWHHGCGPTAVGMVVGYWDGKGYSNLVPGTATQQTAAVNAMIADDGGNPNCSAPNGDHYQDYSCPIDSWPNLLADMSQTGGAHASNCVADFYRTSWSSHGMYYGWSWDSCTAPSFVGYVNLVAPQYNPTATTKYFAQFSWAEYKAEIDAGRPVVFLVDTDNDGITDHFVTGIGYNNATMKYGVRDTWDTGTHWYDWHEIQPNDPWGIYSVTLFRITFKTEIGPTDDAYIRDTDPNTNFGFYGYLHVGHYPMYSPVNIHRSYLKFDLGALPSGATIQTADLYLWPSVIDYPAVDVGAHYLSNDSWSEGSITWNNAPTGFNSTATDLKTIDNAGWVSWDVTPDVQAALAGNGVYSVVMKEPTAEEGQGENCIWFSSKEAGSAHPYLRIGYTVSCCNHDGIRGDVDYSMAVNVADVDYLVQFLFFGGPAPPCFEEADIDCSGSINVADLTYLVAYLFGGGAQPMPCDCPKNSGAVPKGRSDISLNAIYENGMTVISLESPVDLRGIQIELAGQQTGEPIKLVEDDLELFFHQKGDAARVGILDLQGSTLIPKGSHPLVRLPGKFEIVDALVSDLEHNALVPTINPTAKGSNLPTEFSLSQNYPNPFNPTTKINFSLPCAADVRLEIYNIMGQKVATLVDAFVEAGTHSVIWDSRNDKGHSVSSGVYLYRLQAGDFVETKKMVLLK